MQIVVRHFGGLGNPLPTLVVAGRVSQHIRQLEAFHAGLPVLSSNATVLPEVAEDATVYFDPDSPEELPGLIPQVLENDRCVLT